MTDILPILRLSAQSYFAYSCCGWQPQCWALARLLRRLRQQCWQWPVRYIQIYLLKLTDKKASWTSSVILMHKDSSRAQPSLNPTWLFIILTSFQQMSAVKRYLPVITIIHEIKAIHKTCKRPITTALTSLNISCAYRCETLAKWITQDVQQGPRRPIEFSSNAENLQSDMKFFTVSPIIYATHTTVLIVSSK